MENVIQIVAVGSRTPLGLRSAPAAAAVRAGTTALDEHPFMVDSVGDPMPGALDSEQGRSGDSIYGGRLAHRLGTHYEVGVSYKLIENDSKTAITGRAHALPRLS